MSALQELSAEKDKVAALHEAASAKSTKLETMPNETQTEETTSDANLLGTSPDDISGLDPTFPR